MILKGIEKQIIVNAGHHDHDPGKVVGEYTESAEVKKIRDEVVRLLEKDFTVFSVPDSLTLQESIDWSNQRITKPSDGLVIDIHLNANSDSRARGCETYYADSDIQKEVAKSLSSHVSSELGIPDRGPKHDSLTYVGSLGWLRQNKGVASLVEVCFMTNPDDWTALQKDGHKIAAQGIVNSIYSMYDMKQKKKETFSFMKLIQAILELFNFVKNNDDRIREVKNAHENDILKKKNVKGVGIGPKNKTGNTSVVVLVDKKEDLSILSEKDAIPSKIDGVDTDVIEVGDIVPVAEHTNKERPVYGGLSAIWYKGTACTLGAIVFKNGKKYALQNTHCANPHWDGAEIGDKILQPSPNDGGSRRGKADVIGTSAEYKELYFGNKYNDFDSALVELDVDAKELYQEGFGGIRQDPSEVSIGDEVWKSGRTTGVQRSKVIATDMTVNVNYGQEKPGRFRNQIIAENEDGYFTSGGDSSSLVVNEHRQPVGQIFAGSNTIAIFSPIQPIMDYFGFTFAEEKKQEDAYVALEQVSGLPYSVVDRKTLQPGTEIDTVYRMNVRTGPSTSEDIVKVLPKGTRLKVVETPIASDGYIWAKVEQK